VVAWLSSYQVATGRPALAWPGRLPRAAGIATAVVVAVFTVARNTGFAGALAP